MVQFFEYVFKYGITCLFMHGSGTDDLSHHLFQTEMLLHPITIQLVDSVDNGIAISWHDAFINSSIDCTITRYFYKWYLAQFDIKHYLIYVLQGRILLHDHWGPESHQ